MSASHEALPHRIGLGTAPLGNMFRDIPEDEARATLDAAWEQGVRYFDTAPFYGAGLAETRLGAMLAEHDRDEYVLSTKVGRYLLDEDEEKSGLFEQGLSKKAVTDYGAEATRRSIEQSLERLRTDRLDFVFVHDVSRDFHGDIWLDHLATARTGAFRVLAQLQEEGVIRGWGLGVNTTEPIELALDLDETPPTMNLSATQYTLLQHERALERMMPATESRGAGVVVGGPYNSGALMGSDHFDYGEVPAEVSRRVAALGEIAERHGVSVKAAALQFSTAHPAVAAVIPGSSRPQRIAEDLAALQEEIPQAFWQELREQELIAAGAPVPAA